MSSSFRAPPAPPTSPSREIDVVELSQAIWKERKLILAVAIFAILLAAAYAFIATPEYRVTTVLRPSAINALDALNRSEIYRLPPDEALTKVGASLESYETRLGFFREHQKLFKSFEQPGRTLEQSFEAFNRNSVRLLSSDAKKADSLNAYIQMEMNYPKGVDGVAILNGLVDYAITRERNQIAADLDVIVKNRLNEIKGKLDAARSGYNAEKEARIALLTEADALRRAQLQDELKALRIQLKTRRTDRMAQLSEAIGIAKSLGIRKPSTPSSLGESERGEAVSMMRTEINNQQVPLYFMGVDALEAERAALLQRKSDDFTEQRIAQIANELQLLQSNRQIEVLNQRKNEDLFLKGVEPMRAEIARLHNLNMDMGNLQLVAIDKQAVEPTSPIKPNKLLIVILGAFLGVLLGIFSAVCRYFLNLRSCQDRRADGFSLPAVESTLSHGSAQPALFDATR
ncbi:Wzz/FepE/Etk N-terminal domain-containing protein [Pseudomonas paralactis]|uniref:Wzz/FepE/Etk N-terminal domain-containing protein n=1 Tax=Pseudomonas paralactis TaxID=1615673 RepID=UPI0009E87A40|nr:Wzz/FepE/Etk N-terminal domain-containing protein [Pseudomonas paralactis]